MLSRLTPTISVSRLQKFRVMIAGNRCFLPCSPAYCLLGKNTEQGSCLGKSDSLNGLTVASGREIGYGLVELDGFF